MTTPTGSLATRDQPVPARGFGLASLRSQPLAVLLFAVGLLWPLLWLALNGLTPTGYYEESLGYRYFYTLRQLHEPSTYLFLPQGQSANLIFKLVHIALDIGGIPPTQIRPRIYYFYIVSVAVFQLINVAAFAYLLRQALPRSYAVLVALFWLLPFYAAGAGANYILLSPDYLAVEPAIAMLSAALMLKAYRADSWARKDALWHGTLLGVVLATKVTLAVFPGVVLLFLLLTTRPLKRSIVVAAATSFIGGCVWLLIVSADLGFSLQRLSFHFRDLLGFVRSGGGFPPPDQSWIRWIWARAVPWPWISGLTYSMPLLGIAALALARNRRQLALLSSFLAGALAYSFVLFRREYTVTFLESGFYAFMFVWCIWCVWGQSALAGMWGRLDGRLRPAASVLAASVLVYVALAPPYNFALANLPVLVRMSHTEKRFEQMTKDVTGRRLWLVPDNNVRPLSIESAIMKGGSGLTGVWLEPDSPLMRHAVPNLDFRFERRDHGR